MLCFRYIHFEESPGQTTKRFWELYHDNPHNKNTPFPRLDSVPVYENGVFFVQVFLVISH